MKKLFLIFFLSFYCFSYELRSLHFEKDERLSQSKYQKAVGLLVLQSSKTMRITRSGFFFAPNLFLTARDPEEKDLPNCANMTIYTQVTLTGDEEIKADSSYHCKTIRLSNPRFGFMVIETKTKNFNYIPLAETEQIQDWKTSKIFALGYSRKSELLLSKNCKPEPGSCSFCKSTNIKLYLPSWAEAKCLYKKGMSGSPVFFMKEDQWVPIGFIGKYFAASGGPDSEVGEKISLLRIESLQKQFGKTLIGDFEEK